MRYLMMLLILCGSVAVSASPIESLSRLLEPYRTFSADFTQRTLDQDNTPISQMTGQLAIASASVFYWKTDPPFAQSVIADGEVLWEIIRHASAKFIPEVAKP
mgnify:CR=1 FL=1